MFKKYFLWSTLFALAVFATIFGYTWFSIGIVAATVCLYQALTLSIVEVAVSFDNAVVNATHLHRMNAMWRKIFLTVGILIAVIGMRFYLPIEIVSIVGDMSLVDAFKLATSDGKAFGEVLTTAAPSIQGFGGAFLLMTALAFFVSTEKEHHWIPALEVPLAKLAELSEKIKMDAVKLFEAAITLGAAALIANFDDHGREFLIAAVVGVLVFYAITVLKVLIEKMDERISTSKVKWLAGGFGTFIYLEILDASFSFDGVIAAFAISDNLFVIAAGLGVGAIFVRSMTIMLDETGTLKTYRFMENGAFVAIIVLAASMYAHRLVHVPEWFVAVSSILAIGGAVYHSMLLEKKEKATATA